MPSVGIGGASTPIPGALSAANPKTATGSLVLSRALKRTACPSTHARRTGPRASASTACHSPGWTATGDSPVANGRSLDPSGRDNEYTAIPPIAFIRSQKPPKPGPSIGSPGRTRWARKKGPASVPVGNKISACILRFDGSAVPMRELRLHPEFGEANSAPPFPKPMYENPSESLVAPGRGSTVARYSGTR
jgi:hypothetical protein